MENEALIQLNNLPAVQDDADFNAMSAGGGFLPRVQLITSKSEHINDGFPVNHFALIEGTTPIDLGASVDCVPVAWRPCYVDMSGDTVIANYKPNLDKQGVPQNPVCADIVTRSTEVNSKCMWGPQFLLWLVGPQRFALLLMGSKSARRESVAVRQRLGYPSTLIPKKCESKKYPPWFVTSIQACSLLPDSLPEREALEAEIGKFNNPPDSEAELAPKETAERER